MRFLPIVLLLCFTSFLTAQKLIKKSVLNNSASLININTENCFKVILETGKSNTVLLEAEIEGEYQDDLSVLINEKGSSIFISTGFNPDFKNPNDKLSAHKVVSVFLRITLPEYQNVRLYGKSSNVNASGNYENLNISLSDGYCRLKNVKGNTTAKTLSGNIYLESDKILVKATSKYGEVKIGNSTKGNNFFDLSSTTGNILVSETK